MPCRVMAMVNLVSICPFGLMWEPWGLSSTIILFTPPYHCSIISLLLGLVDGFSLADDIQKPVR